MKDKKSPQEEPIIHVETEPKFNVGDLVFLTLARQVGIIEELASWPRHYRIKGIGTVPEDELRHATLEEKQNYARHIRNYPFPKPEDEKKI